MLRDPSHSDKRVGLRAQLSSLPQWRPPPPGAVRGSGRSGYCTPVTPLPSRGALSPPRPSTSGLPFQPPTPVFRHYLIVCTIETGFTRSPSYLCDRSNVLLLPSRWANCCRYHTFSPRKLAVFFNIFLCNRFTVINRLGFFSNLLV